MGGGGRGNSPVWSSCHLLVYVQMMFLSSVSQYIPPHLNPIMCKALYRNDPKFSDQYAWASSADPDQTVPRGAV